MTHRHLICLVVDGLRASALGAYGNTTFPTPQLDALASRALVADWLWADSPQLPSFYQSAWQGLHKLRHESNSQQASVLQQLQQANVQQWLVTDDAWLTQQADQLPFNDALLFENDSQQSANDLEETTLARFFSEAIERLHQWREDTEDLSSLAWLHCQGLAGPWDAPLSLREDLLDEEDPPAAEFVQPPTTLLDVTDPDELLTYRVAYAAQIEVLDACVGAFIQAVEEEFVERETLIMVTSSRGFALGEHGAVGIDCSQLFSEQLHLPWMLYPCGNNIPLPRIDNLSQPTDIGATLLDWFGVEATAALNDGISLAAWLSGEASAQRQLAISQAVGGESAVRTPAWMLRQSPDPNQPTELYTKPDDRWENNDVASLCPEIVESLERDLANSRQCCQLAQPLPRTPDESELVTPQR